MRSVLNTATRGKHGNDKRFGVPSSVGFVPGRTNGMCQLGDIHSRVDDRKYSV